MSDFDTNGHRLFIARHGETIFNLAGRMQGDHTHTPLTLTGFAQADEMGRALALYLGESMSKPAHAEPVEASGSVQSILRQAQDERHGAIDLIASNTDRALQTLSIISELIGADWHGAEQEERLKEIDMGEWGGLYYRDLEDKLEFDRENMLFANVAPGGEDYADIAKRLTSWLSEYRFERDTVLISHGMTSRVLRGMLRGLPEKRGYGAPIADGLPQGSIVQICDREEQIINLGGGEGEKA